ncbi:YndM family protein [Bacillus sp. CECT 9360]|uniref:YndM family protein n=1 Tax=Bacillus sp. CECT 9360 TaxID=2845821 RepID=UPI001E632058|nr:YndM family protein [Bacillus sp. CECT 9360]CAH0344116.1 hypothetical protein BCI9360_00347 [Bacillus sp. CECT 9360]
MRHLRTIMVKFVSTLVLLYIVLSLAFGMSFTSVVLIAVTLNVVAYIIGDLVILPRTNNYIATLADFSISLIIIWSLVSGMTTVGNPIYITFIAATLIAMFEYLYHRYVARNTFPRRFRPRWLQGVQYQTETAEEIYPFTPQDKEKK